MVDQKMAWTKGAVGNFPASLKIQGDMIAYIEMIGEPEVWEKTEDDKRPHISVKYLGGTAIASPKGAESHPAEKEEVYTLWMGKTLAGSILSALGWVEGKPAPSLDGKRFKVWRTQEKVGGNRLYDASLMEGEDIESDEMASLVKKIESGTLINTLRALKELNHETWRTFLTGEGVNNPEALTEKMVEMGLITTDDKNVYPVEA